MMQRDKKAERKRCWGEGRSMIRDQEPGLTQGWEEPHFVVILLWLVLRAVVQEQAYILHARTALPLCWLIPPTYKTHKIEKNECKCQEICPCSQQPKKELVYDTYDRAVTHSFSDGMIPLGSLLLANIEHIFLQFIFPVWFIPHIHLEKHAQHHHNSCTAKSITILIDHGFVSCSNTDNKFCPWALLSQEMTKQIHPGQWNQSKREPQAPNASMDKIWIHPLKTQT